MASLTTPLARRLLGPMSLGLALAIVATVLTLLASLLAVRWVRPPDLSYATRTLRIVVSLFVPALPVLWAVVVFVLVLTPTHLAIPVFGTIDVWSRAVAPATTRWERPDDARWACEPPLVERRAVPGSDGRTTDGTINCGPVTFKYHGIASEGSTETVYSRDNWRCVSHGGWSGTQRCSMTISRSSDTRWISYACVPDASGDGLGAVGCDGQFSMRRERMPVGPGDRLPIAIVLLGLSLVLAVVTLRWLRRIGERGHALLSSNERYVSAAAVSEATLPSSLLIQPFRSVPFTSPGVQGRTDGRTVSIGRGIRRRWWVVVAFFALVLAASITLVVDGSWRPRGLTIVALNARAGSR